MRVAAAFVLALVLTGSAAAAQDRVVFVVRHAERADVPAAQQQQNVHTMLGADPPLTPAGQARAQKLAQVLRSEGIKHIFTTEFKRTRDTAAPLAQQEKVKAVMAPAKDVDVLVQRLREIRDPALVVGHADTVPEILKKLGVADVIKIADNEFDNLFVVVRPATGKPTLIRLRF